MHINIKGGLLVGNKKIIFVIILLGLLVFLFILFFPKSESDLKNKKAEVLYNEAKLFFKEHNYSKALETYNSIIENYPEHENIPYIYYDLFKIYESQDKLIKAKNMLEAIINDFSNVDIIKKVQKNLEDLNIRILFSPLDTKYDIIYEVQKGDTLVEIAKKYNTTVDLIKKSNNLENNAIFPGMKLKIINSEFSILVIKSQNILTLKLSGEILKSYKISTGKGGYNSTPIGTFYITTKLPDPVWYKNGKKFLPQDPENVLGSRWMGLSKKGYGIHGTTEPDSIGKPITEGCVRMYNSDVEELYSLVPVGTKVNIIE